MFVTYALCMIILGQLVCDRIANQMRESSVNTANSADQMKEPASATGTVVWYDSECSIICLYPISSIIMATAVQYKLTNIIEYRIQQSVSIML